MKLRTFQTTFLRRALDPDVDTAALSIPRGNGKSFLAARILTRCMTPGDPLQCDPHGRENLPLRPSYRHALPPALRGVHPPCPADGQGLNLNPIRRITASISRVRGFLVSGLVLRQFNKFG